MIEVVALIVEVVSLIELLVSVALREDVDRVFVVRKVKAPSAVLEMEALVVAVLLAVVKDILLVEVLSKRVVLNEADRVKELELFVTDFEAVADAAVLDLVSVRIVNELLLKVALCEELDLVSVPKVTLKVGEVVLVNDVASLVLLNVALCEVVERRVNDMVSLRVLGVWLCDNEDERVPLVVSLFELLDSVAEDELA